MDQKKKTLKDLIDELVSLGEDQEELSLFLGVFDALDEEAQNALLQNLAKEKDELAKLEGK